MRDLAARVFPHPELDLHCLHRFEVGQFEEVTPLLQEVAKQEHDELLLDAFGALVECLLVLVFLKG